MCRTYTNNHPWPDSRPPPPLWRGTRLSQHHIPSLPLLLPPFRPSGGCWCGPSTVLEQHFDKQPLWRIQFACSPHRTTGRWLLQQQSAGPAADCGVKVVSCGGWWSGDGPVMVRWWFGDGPVMVWWWSCDGGQVMVWWWSGDGSVITTTTTTTTKYILQLINIKDNETCDWCKWWSGGCPVMVRWVSSDGPVVVQWWSGCGPVMVQWWSVVGPVMGRWWWDDCLVIVWWWSSDGPLKVR